MPRKDLPRALQLADGGVLTRAQLRAGGLDDDLGDRLVREGGWLRLAPSVYLTSPGPPTDDQLVRAARAHAGPDVVITGLVACRALGLADVPDARRVQVLTEAGRVVSSPYVRVHETGRRPQTWSRRGAAYAMADRAVVDAARGLTDLRSVRALVLGAVCLGRCTAQELSVEVEAGAQRGSGLVRRAVDDALAGAWSAPEAEAAELVASAVRARRLPPFLLNPVLLLGGRRVGQPDGLLIGTSVGWQVDSRRHHADDDGFDRTLAVHDDFAAVGLTLLHVTPRRLRAAGPAWVDCLVDAITAGHRPPRGLQVQPVGPLQRGPRRRPLG